MRDDETTRRFEVKVREDSFEKMFHVEGVYMIRLSLFTGASKVSLSRSLFSGVIPLLEAIDELGNIASE